MDSKGFFLGFFGYAAGALLEAILIILVLFLSVSLLGALGLLVTLFFVLVAIWGAFRMLRKYGEKDLKIELVTSRMVGMAVLFFILIIGVVLWQFAPAPTPTRNAYTSWNKLQPIGQAIEYRAEGQNFSAAFNNVLGTRLRLDAVAVREMITNTYCNNVKVKGNPEVNQTIKAGDVLFINAECGAAKKRKDDTYEMEITVNYTVFAGNLSTKHFEKGRIRGAVEA